jgi:hypothetical protein
VYARRAIGRQFRRVPVIVWSTSWPASTTRRASSVANVSSQPQLVRTPRAKKMALLIVPLMVVMTADPSWCAWLRLTERFE